MHHRCISVTQNLVNGAGVPPWLNQEGYQKRYNGLAEWFDGVKARLDKITHTITERQVQRERIEMFLAGLEKQEGLLTEFDENLWYSMVEYVTFLIRKISALPLRMGRKSKCKKSSASD